MEIRTDYAGVTSNLFGLIRSVVETAHRPEHALIHVITAESGEVNHLVTGGPSVIGSGASITHAAALRSAIGEVLERYSARWVPTQDHTLGSYLDLDETAPHPAGFALFHASQYREPGFPFVPFGEHTVLSWVPAVEIASGSPSWLPGQLVYLQHGLGSPEDRISYNTSSGLACGATYDDALLRALLEVLERDAAMLTWYLQYSPPRIDITSDEGLTAIERDHFDVHGVHHVALDLSAFHRLPTVLVLVEDDDPSAGGSALGSACALDPRTAWLKAMTEAYHTRQWAFGLARKRQRRIVRPEDVRGLEDHVGFYTVPQNLRHLEFLKRREATVPIERLPSWDGRSASDAAIAIARALQSSGVSCYAAEVTAPDVVDAGFRVVRVVCPELCRLDVSHRTRHLGGERLYSVSAHLGLTDRRLDFDDLNPYPHPFP